MDTALKHAMCLETAGRLSSPSLALVLDYRSGKDVQDGARLEVRPPSAEQHT